METPCESVRGRASQAEGTACAKILRQDYTLHAGGGLGGCGAAGRTQPCSGLLVFRSSEELTGTLGLGEGGVQHPWSRDPTGPLIGAAEWGGQVVGVSGVSVVGSSPGLPIAPFQPAA